jgi:hypothetical protein
MNNINILFVRIDLSENNEDKKHATPELLIKMIDVNCCQPFLYSRGKKEIRQNIGGTFFLGSLRSIRSDEKEKNGVKDI